MDSKKVELLSPAGDFECFMAAICAGADAVYLGGDKFGARAYANNFSTQEIIDALKIAHLFSRKIYLTVNTLVKENEISELIPFMKPLVEAGLDGVIIQDIGVFLTLRENFPNLELHASTQMTITGKYGARFLKKLGATRIVPARELSLDEIGDIKKDTGLEIETFIHGAMCYAYSGQCLFSSILGGRSGNRGRCAGPCRLPYDVNGKAAYPLSLKDMYTLNNIHELIEAGIDSFKIEGRMKSPEYVAGVTAMYRKYIDKYYENPNEKTKVSKEDENLLRNLYIRSDICEGYYHQHNDKSMVTIHEPGYKGCDENSLNLIKKKYLENKPVLNINGEAKILAGQPAYIKITYKDIIVETYSDVVSVAQKRPLLKEDIIDKLNKTGNTCFKFDSLEIETDNNSFMPVKALNDLRREAIEKLENEILATREKKTFIYDENHSLAKKNDSFINDIFVFISDIEQLKEVCRHDMIKGIYINSDLLLKKENASEVENVIKTNQNISFYLALPAIFRKRSYKYLEIYKKYLAMNLFRGVLVRNIEEYMWLQECNYDAEIIADYNIYSWNKKTLELYNEIFTRTVSPVELNRREISDIKTQDREIVLYTRLPLMYSANCVKKTLEKCVNDSSKRNIYYLTDRQKNKIPIMQNCFHCFNVLYNPVVMSLHNQYEILKRENFTVYRIDFTLESVEETKQILKYYERLIIEDVKGDFPVADYTAGHYKRGVE